MKNLYEILGIKKTKNKAKIKAAYRERCKTVHPYQGGTQEQFVELNKAYKILMNEDLKNRYDSGENFEDIFKPVNDKVFQLIAVFLSKALDSFNAETQNIVELMVQEMNAAIDKITTEINNSEGLIKNYHNCLKKIKYKGNNDNILAQIINGKILNKTELVEKFKKEREHFEKAVVILKDFDYDLEELTRLASSVNRSGFSYFMTSV